MGVSEIKEVRKNVFVTLAGGEKGTLSARYLKGDRAGPTTPAKLLNGNVKLFISHAQMRQAHEQHKREIGLRPNLTAQFQRWFYDEPKSLRGKADPENLGFWYSATTAANFYRLLYSDKDYPSATFIKETTKKQATSVNGFDEWAFANNGGGKDYLLLVNSTELPTLQAWLDQPEGPPPLPIGPSEDSLSPKSTTEQSFALSPKKLEQLVQTIRSITAPTAEEIQQHIAAYQERFSLERLARLEGAELLYELHGRENKDCWVYWLEFKNDKTFNNTWFGGIRGGTSLKFGVYQSDEDGSWRTGSSRKTIVIDENDAIEIASRQRDQLLAAVAVLQALAQDGSAAAYASLQNDIEAAAPDFHHLAFFHKALCLYCPDAIDDYHVVPYQEHIITQLGVVPPEGPKGIYRCAGSFVSALRQLRKILEEPIPMRRFTAALNRLYGAPIHHWRVGTGESGEHWPIMRDQEFVAIGWGELGDLADRVSGYGGREGVQALKAAIVEQWPDRNKSLVTREANQLWAFYNVMKEGDRVYVAYGQTIYGVGEIVSTYQYVEDDFAYSYRRRVKWLSTDSFKAISKAGLQTTVYELHRALDIQAQAARHLDSAVAPAGPKPKPSRIANALAPVAEQLERKGQVILYGPPGTGKTYQALQVAEEMVARSSCGRAWGDLSAEERRALKGGSDPASQRIWTCTFHPAYGYEDFVEGLRAKPVAGGLEFRPEPGLFRRICALAAKHRSEDFVIIIDEFNRGDSPRIFGELLTLLELDKRERVHVQLPLSGDSFTVPRKVRILATMNTADRSISLLDAALRRRFGFVEYLPEPKVLGETSVQGLKLAEFLKVLNERLISTLGESARNLQVGHAYLMSEAQAITSLIALRNAIRYDLFPLLQEYCAEDPAALHQILGDAFYKRDAQKFNDELLEKGREVEFIDALISWDPARLSAEGIDEADEEADELDDEE